MTIEAKERVSQDKSDPEISPYSSQMCSTTFLCTSYLRGTPDFIVPLPYFTYIFSFSLKIAYIYLSP